MASKRLALSDLVLFAVAELFVPVRDDVDGRGLSIRAHCSNSTGRLTGGLALPSKSMISGAVGPLGTNVSGI